MRARSVNPHLDRGAAAAWLELDADELADPEDGVDTRPRARSPGGARRGGTVSDREASGGGAAAFGDRFALGTGQFEVPSPSPHGALRGSPDDTVARIMTRKVVCARPEMDASFLRARLLERGVSGAPVVDDWGRVVGVASKTDLLEHEITSERGQKTVADIMMPMAFTLPADASIGQAAALMAYEGVHRVVVVDDRGCVVGLVTALDVARWLGWCARLPVGREP